MTVGSGTVPVRAPRVNDKRVDEETGERKRFSSRILPAYARRSPKVTEVLPILYLHGLSTGDFGPALQGSARRGRLGLSSSSIQRLTETWQAEHAAFRTRELRFHRYAYLFVDGVNVSVRLGEDPKLCLLVVIGVREDGEKELLAVEDGYRESPRTPGAAVLRDLRDRGLNEPKLVTGDGALGAWAALRNVFPGAREQRCWVHKTANVLDALPKRLQPRAKTLLHEMAEAPVAGGRWQGARAVPRRVRRQVPQGGRQARQGLGRADRVLRLPRRALAAPRTTNPIESSFATVKLRTTVTKGAGSKKAALAMAYKLLDAAQERWRRFNGHELVADVLAGVKFKDGITVTDDDTTTNGREGRRLKMLHLLIHNS